MVVHVASVKEIVEQITSLDAEPRIHILGTSGSGKSTLGNYLSQQLNIPHTQLDEIYFNANWEPKPEAEFKANLDTAISQECWVLDGNYSQIQPVIRTRATVLIWINYSFWTTFRQLFWRTVSRAWTQEELYCGNKESFRQSFFSRDSILLWMIQTHQKYRKGYEKLFEELSTKDFLLIELTHPKQARVVPAE